MEYTIRSARTEDMGQVLQLIQELASFEKDSRNYKKYTKILAKHIKSFSMKKRVNSHIKTIESVEKISQEKES